MSAIHFMFPKVPSVHVLFLLRNPDDISQDDPYSGGNISYDVGDDPAKVTQYRQQIIANYASLGLKTILDVRQVHGEEVIFEPEKENLSVLTGDGLATKAPHQGLLIKTADCQPLLICDLSGQHILALHIGWRANLANFIAKAIPKFCHKYDLTPKSLLAVRGPSLSPIQAQFKNYQKEWPENLLKTYFDYEHLTMNLWALTRDQLEAAGLKRANIFSLDLCTQTNPHCFSYRRDKTCGRQGGLIWLA
ncbi:MAG: laccase domain-containing protein [Desulfovibrionaceae bacterium]|nr:laccase domain-containing protein [Desulfovibrionaceae bacterium]